VLKTAASDVYYHGVRLVTANLLWGIAFLVTGYLLSRNPVGVFLVVAMVPLTVGLMGMATDLVRDRTLVMSDFVAGVRRRFVPHLLVGVAQIGLWIVSAVDLSVAVQVGGPLGMVLGVVAFYTAIGTWLIAVVAWPILLDPIRADLSTPGQLRLALLLCLAHPARLAAFGALMGLFLVVSTILIAALITVSVAFAFVAAAHYVLPAADRLEGRATLERYEE
jgi:uncharacterized membrane protein YesL